MSQVAKINPESATQMTALDLVGAAVQAGQTDQIDKLIELVKFNDEREALRAFNEAFTKAQSEFPAVFKSKKAHNSNYAPYASIVNAVRPVLDKHGLSFRHTVTETEKGVTVTCVLAHAAGHCESTSLTAPPDTSGSKNAIQSIGSSVTYLKRYTLEAITGLVTTDDDTDGNLVGNYITEKQALDLEAMADEVGADKQRFLKAFEVDSFSHITPEQYPRCLKGLAGKAKQ